MPTYEYKCHNCGHQFEERQTITAEPLIDCPICDKPQLVRGIGGGQVTLNFKGYDFYVNNRNIKDLPNN